jgi:polyferredoxin
VKSFSRGFFLVLSVIVLFAGPLKDWLDKLHSADGFSPVVEYIPAWLSGWVVKFSPLQAVNNIRYNLEFSWVFIFSLTIALLFLFMAVFKGRFFCNWVCPMGTLHSIFSKLSFKKHFLKKRLSGYIFWIMLSSAAVGVPLLSFCDPLVQFTKLNLETNVGTMLYFLPVVAIVLLFLLLNVIQPKIWCSHLCPLGYLFTIVHRKNSNSNVKVQIEGRREFLGGMIAGIAGAFIFSKSGQSKAPAIPVLPPGSVPANEFSLRCIRCYACVNVCPSKILTVKVPSGKPLAEWFQPEMDPEKGCCEENCKKCTDVCPVLAIKPLPVEIKKKTQIGIAEVIKPACIAWSYGQHCMVCSEFCPYVAIDVSEDEKGIPRPVVNASLCRGCGFCQNNCPAREKGKAIFVRGVPEQKILNPPA